MRLEYVNFEQLTFEILVFSPELLDCLFTHDSLFLELFYLLLLAVDFFFQESFEHFAFVAVAK